MTGAEQVPPEVRAGVSGTRDEAGPIGDITGVERLGGGCIHPAARVGTESGRTYFLKWSRAPGPAGFGAEARGLEALAGTDGPRVPEVIGYFDGEAEERGWLLLELIEHGTAGPHTAERLGEELARMHRALPGADPGWEEDGFIGPLPQANLASGQDWPSFWVEARLSPQWERARRRMGAAADEMWRRVSPPIGAGLAGWEEDGLSVLHGDLWGGNVLTDDRGNPVLIDPAVYRGHREVDLAMMELFGGFRPATFDRYREVAPLAPGYEERRRDIYQLYPLLVHVNLFGGGYVESVRERLSRLEQILS